MPIPKRIVVLSIMAICHFACSVDSDGNLVFDPGANSNAGGSNGGATNGGGDSEDVILNANCDIDARVPCSSVVTRDDGVVIQLGPYGSIMEVNVGRGFENSVSIAEAFCDTFAAAFGEDPEITADLLDLRDLDLALYTVFRPANMVTGEKYPIITWGNGTCAQPGGYGALLHYVASQGFFVFAANSRYVAGGAMISALDFAFSANQDPTSPYYQRLDTTKVGAMGHSQGGLATVDAANDSRVKSVILFNGGTTASKPFLAIGGDYDITGSNVTPYITDVNAAPQAAYIYYHQVPVTGNFSGHLTLMFQPERVTEATAGWWKYMLNGDTTARDLFVGLFCGLCNRDVEFEYGQHGLP